ncbi:lipoprotein, partial [Mesoplasma chauliocola]
MKKLLGILAATGIAASSASLVVACGSKENGAVDLSNALTGYIATNDTDEEEIISYLKETKGVKDLKSSEIAVVTTIATANTEGSVWIHASDKAKSVTGEIVLEIVKTPAVNLKTALKDVYFDKTPTVQEVISALRQVKGLKHLEAYEVEFDLEQINPGEINSVEVKATNSAKIVEGEGNIIVDLSLINLNELNVEGLTDKSTEEEVAAAINAAWKAANTESKKTITKDDVTIKQTTGKIGSKGSITVTAKEDSEKVIGQVTIETAALDAIDLSTALNGLKLETPSVSSENNGNGSTDPETGDALRENEVLALGDITIAGTPVRNQYKADAKNLEGKSNQDVIVDAFKEKNTGAIAEDATVVVKGITLDGAKIIVTPAADEATDVVYNVTYTGKNEVIIPSYEEQIISFLNKKYKGELSRELVTSDIKLEEIAKPQINKAGSVKVEATEDAKNAGLLINSKELATPALPKIELETVLSKEDLSNKALNDVVIEDIVAVINTNLNKVKEESENLSITKDDITFKQTLATSTKEGSIVVTAKDSANLITGTVTITIEKIEKVNLNIFNDAQGVFVDYKPKDGSTQESIQADVLAKLQTVKGLKKLTASDVDIKAVQSSPKLSKDASKYWDISIRANEKSELVKGSASMLIQEADIPTVTEETITNALNDAVQGKNFKDDAEAIAAVIAVEVEGVKSFKAEVKTDGNLVETANEEGATPETETKILKVTAEAAEGYQLAKTEFEVEVNIVKEAASDNKKDITGLTA